MEDPTLRDNARIAIFSEESLFSPYISIRITYTINSRNPQVLILSCKVTYLKQKEKTPHKLRQTIRHLTVLNVNPKQEPS